MDRLYTSYSEHALHFTNLPMAPFLLCVHFSIVTLKLRMQIGTTFAQTNPLACWISAVISNFAGSLVISFLLGLPLVLPLRDTNALMLMTAIWYLVFFCPYDLFTKFFMFQPAWIVLAVLKEAHRAKGMLGGVKMGMERYPSDVVIIVLVGLCKGAGALLVKPVSNFIRGSLDASNHEAIKPSFTTKTAIVTSILYTLSLQGVIPVSTELLCLGAFILLALVKVSLIVTDTSDPFLRIESAISPICFGTPKEKANTSDSKKKKE